MGICTIRSYIRIRLCNSWREPNFGKLFIHSFNKYIICHTLLLLNANYSMKDR